jgi:hypothetical protein
MSAAVAVERRASGANDTSAHGTEDGDDEDDADADEVGRERSALPRASSVHATRRWVRDGIANNARKVFSLAIASWSVRERSEMLWVRARIQTSGMEKKERETRWELEASRAHAFSLTTSVSGRASSVMLVD